MARVDQTIDTAPIDDRGQSKALGNRAGVDALSKTQPHEERFVRCLFG
jgi:hypothetical protein